MDRTLRRQKLVSVCSVIDSNDCESITYTSSNIPSRKTKCHIYVKAPISAVNLLMLEIYPETKEILQEQACHKLNIIALCCDENTTVDDIPCNFQHDYYSVEVVDLSGHIGSMRLAFQLLHKFIKLREVGFYISDQNVQFPLGKEDSFEGLQKYYNVESVRIFHDLSVITKENKDLQFKKWRLDEFLDGCRACFPNLKKVDVSLFGSGCNFEKIKDFVEENSHLSCRFSVEIQNDRVKTKPIHHRATMPSKLKALPAPTPQPIPDIEKPTNTGNQGLDSEDLTTALALRTPFGFIKTEPKDTYETVVVNNPTSTLPKSISINSEQNECFDFDGHSSLPQTNSGYVNYSFNHPSALGIRPPLRGVCSREKGVSTSLLANTQIVPSQPFGSSNHFKPKAQNSSSFENATARVDSTNRNSFARQSFASDSVFSEEEEDESRLRSRNPSPPTDPMATIPVLSNPIPSTSHTAASITHRPPIPPDPPTLSKQIPKFKNGANRKIKLVGPYSSDDGEVTSDSSNFRSQESSQESRNSGRHYDAHHDFRRSKSNTRSRYYSPSKSSSRSPYRSRSRSQSRSPYRSRRRSSSRSPDYKGRKYNYRRHSRHASPSRSRSPAYYRRRTRSRSPSSSSPGNPRRGKGFHGGNHRGYNGTRFRGRGRGRGFRGGRGRGRGRGGYVARGGFKSNTNSRNDSQNSDFNDPRQDVQSSDFADPREEVGNWESYE